MKSMFESFDVAFGWSSVDVLGRGKPDKGPLSVAWTERS